MSSIYQMLVFYNPLRGERLFVSILAHFGGHQPKQVGNSIPEARKQGREVGLLRRQLRCI